MPDSRTIYGNVTPVDVLATNALSYRVKILILAISNYYRVFRPLDR